MATGCFSGNTFCRFAVDVGVSGLENDDLATFDLNVAYDDSILAFSSYSLGDELGEISLGEALDLSGGDIGGGIVNLAELSWLIDLTAQPDAFTLATINFVGTAAGESDLFFSGVVLGDELGNPLVPTSPLGTASITVQGASVPEPSTLALMAIGLAAVGYQRRRIKKAA